MKKKDDSGKVVGFNQADGDNLAIENLLDGYVGKALPTLPMLLVNWEELDPSNFSLSGYNRVQFNAFCGALGLRLEPSSELEFRKIVNMARCVRLAYNRAVSRNELCIESDPQLQPDALVHLNAFLQGSSTSLQPLFEGDIFKSHTAWVVERSEMLNKDSQDSAPELQQTTKTDNVVPLFKS